VVMARLSRVLRSLLHSVLFWGVLMSMHAEWVEQGLIMLGEVCRYTT